VQQVNLQDCGPHSRRLEEKKADITKSEGGTRSLEGTYRTRIGYDPAVQAQIESAGYVFLLALDHRFVSAVKVVLRIAHERNLRRRL
jgi:hypothetical protein